MKKDSLKEIIRDFHVAPLPSLIGRDVAMPFHSGKIITLVGARRSGKTSVLFNLIDELVKAGTDFKNILYVNFEDERIDLELNELDLDLLKVDMNTPLEVSTDGRNLIISPVESGKREKRFRAALEKVNKTHGKTLRKLSK